MVKLIVLITVVFIAQSSWAADNPECPKHILKLVYDSSKAKTEKSSEPNEDMLDAIAEYTKIDYTTTLEIFRLVQGLTEAATFQVNLKEGVSVLTFFEHTQRLGIPNSLFKDPGPGVVKITIKPSEISLLNKTIELTLVKSVELYLRK